MGISIERLRKAVEIAAQQPGGIDYQAELDEIIELEDRLKDNKDYDLWQGDIQLVDTAAMCDLMNIATYDDYGKAAKLQNGKLSLDEYRASIKFLDGCLTDENLRCGYEIIADLWSDNEVLGENNPDGTFNKVEVRRR